MSNSNFSSHGVQSHHATPRNLGIQAGKLSQEQNSLLRQQNTKLDTIATNTASVNVNTDTLEALTTSGNNILTSIDNKIVLPSVLNSDQLKVNDSAVVGSLAQINNNVDGLETAISDTNSKIDAMRGSNSLTDLATKLNAGLPSALDSDRLKVVDGDVASKIDALRASDSLTTLKGALALNSTLNDTNSKIDAMRGSNSITDLATKLNAGLPSALSSDRLKVIDSDAEAHLGNIETSVQLIDDVVKAEDTAHSSGDKGVMILGVRQSSQADFGADGDYVPISVNDDGEIRVTTGSGASGGATEAKQDVIEATLTAIETDAAAIETLLIGIDADTDAIKTDAAAIEVLLTGIDEDTNAIKTSVEAIDNAVDGNYLNVNLNLAGSDVDANSGNKSAATPRVVVATDDVNMSAIKTATEASATDLAALEVLQTSTNTKLDHLSDNLDTLETTLTAIETDQAALEVLHTATNSKIDTLDTVLDNIKIDTEAIETAVEALNSRDSLTTTLIIDAQSVASSGSSHTSSSFEITNRPKGDGKLHFLLRIATVSPGDIQMTFQGSADNTNFFTIPLSFVQTENTTTGVGQVGTLAFVPKHLKVTLTNNNFSSAATCTVHMFN